MTTYSCQDGDRFAETNENEFETEIIPKPDRIFACVGKGIKGAITEFRYGLEASLGLEMDYDAPIISAWTFLSTIHQDDGDDGSLFLLSIGDSSALLRLSSDATDVSELDESSTKLDLSHRTIVATVQGHYLVQVTERSVTYIHESER